MKIFIRGRKRPSGKEVEIELLKGVERILKFPFDFSKSSDLAVGIPVWTPLVNDFLLDAWIETLDSDSWVFDGEVQPFADIGLIDSGEWVSGTALFQSFLGPAVDLTSGTWTKVSDLISIQGGASPVTDLLAGTISSALPYVKFLTTMPLSLVVSGDGTPSGDVFDGSAGSSILYLKVSSPSLS